MRYQNTRFLNFLFIALFCFFSQTGFASPEKTEIENVYHAWCDAIGSAHGNFHEIIKYYSPNAILLPTLSPKILVNKNGGLNDYFKELTSKPNIKCNPEKLITRIYGKIAINAGFYSFSYEQNGAKKVVPARFSFVYEKQGNQWLIVNHHSSILPDQA